VSRVLISAPEAVDLVSFLASAIDAKVERLDLSQVMDISAIPALTDSAFVRRHSPRWARHYAKKAGRYESADQSVQPDFHEAAKNIFVADHAASAIFDSGRFAAFLWLCDISVTTVTKTIGAKRQTLRCRASALGASNRRVFAGTGESAITE